MTHAKIAEIRVSFSTLKKHVGTVSLETVLPLVVERVAQSIFLLGAVFSPLGPGCLLSILHVRVLSNHPTSRHMVKRKQKGQIVSACEKVKVVSV